MKKFDAIFFDLDGTLVDSALDFVAMRRDLGFDQNVDILGHIGQMTDADKVKHCFDIIDRHEAKGALESILYPGVKELLDFISEQGIQTGILTRNNQKCTKLSLEKHNLYFEHIITRDDCKPKPDPEGLNILLDKTGIEANRAIYIGDYLHDLEVAKNAGMFSGLYRNTKNESFEPSADIIIHSYNEFRLEL